MQSIACLTEWSTSGRASPSHWDSEEQSLVLREVRTLSVIQAWLFLRAVCSSKKNYKLLSDFMFISVLVPSADRDAEVLYEVLFDEEFAGGLNIR